MAYRLVAQKQDDSDLAGGAVLRSAPGFPAFPARLAEELFLRAAEYLPERPLTVWDPCCGSGYLLTVLGLRRRSRLAAVVASDIAPDAVGLARDNLALLTRTGLRARGDALRARHAAFGKQVHADAAAAADRLTDLLRAGGGDLRTASFVADAFDVDAARDGLADVVPDVVITDVPYGNQTGWLGTAPSSDDPFRALVGVLGEVLRRDAVVVITARARRIPLPGMPLLERLRVGTRASVLLRAGDGRDAA